MASASAAWAAASPRSCPSRRAGEPELRDLPVELIRPNADQPRTPFDADAARRARGLDRGGGRRPAADRPPARDGRYELIAGERRWRAAQQAGLTGCPAVLRTEASRAPPDGADREHGPRGPQPDRRGPRLRGPGRRPRPHQGGPRPPRRPQPRRDLEPDPPARPARPGARRCSSRRAHRGPRPRDAPGQRPGRPPPRSPAGRVAEGWSVRETERRAKGPRSEGREAPQARAASAPTSARDRRGRGRARARRSAATSASGAPASTA